jgi:hypothetical protein
MFSTLTFHDISRLGIPPGESMATQISSQHRKAKFQKRRTYLKAMKAIESP